MAWPIAHAGKDSVQRQYAGQAIMLQRCGVVLSSLTPPSVVVSMYLQCARSSVVEHSAFNRLVVRSIRTGRKMSQGFLIESAHSIRWMMPDERTA